MRIIVVRHGQAVPKKGWTGPDDERPLLGRGRRQAARLRKVIGRQQPTRVLSSPALRCLQTVQPLAERYSLTVETAEPLSTLAPDEAAGLCHELVRSEPPDAVVVLCTHREVLNVLLPRISKDFGYKFRYRLPGAKGGAWILRFRSDRLRRVEYRPPAA